VIAAWDDESITKACEKFAAFVKKQGKKNTLTIAADYSVDGVVAKGFGAIPHYGSTKNKVQFIDLADKSYMLYVPSTTKKAFSEYLNSLTQQGFTEFSYRTAGKYMTYATYCNEETILHISFNSSTDEARIAADKAYDMTVFTDQEYEKVCEPTVSLVGQEVEVSTGWIYNALCLVFRLEDGRFVIVDGGYSQFSVNKLYKTLRSLHVNEGKITIAAWIFTHPHSDHSGAFEELTNTSIKRRIVVENFIHHFASDAQHNTIGSFGTAKTTRSAMRNYRNANIIKAHSGQVFKFAGMEFEMLFTYADMEPEKLDTMNTSSLVFRVTARDNSVMVLGDASNRSLNYLIDTYGDYLESDMVQIAHHGYNGVADAYSYIGADVVLFPGGVNQFYGRRNLYRIKDWEFNKRALDLAEECYVAGDSVFTLILPYTPANNRSVKIYDGE
ncbi:MAG: MBL fold metallo-hydrolase, partial [Clostridia bacterium]|nr:MBL fold metallo-hydrolase [Clostridia bacterium]